MLPHKRLCVRYYTFVLCDKNSKHGRNFFPEETKWSSPDIAGNRPISCRNQSVGSQTKSSYRKMLAEEGGKRPTDRKCWQKMRMRGQEREEEIKKERDTERFSFVVRSVLVLLLLFSWSLKGCSIFSVDWIFIWLYPTNSTVIREELLNHFDHWWKATVTEVVLWARAMSNLNIDVCCRG